MDSGGTVDTVFIGGGVIGLSAAWKVAADGGSVVVVDPAPGHGATWAAAGMLAPVGEAHFGEEHLVHLTVEAARGWPEFARQLEAASGHPLGYRASGTVLAAMDASDRRHIDDVLGFQLGLGLEARRLSSAECRSLEPLLAPGVRGGAEFRDDHQVDNRRLVGALVEACRRAGVRLVSDRVVSVATTPSRVTGVVLADGGSVAAPTVVLAAGSQSGQLSGIPARSVPPVRPVKGLTLRLRAPGAGPALTRTVRGLIHGRTAYLVPREDGTLVVGATVEEKGFDLTVQAGPVHQLLDDARALVPSLDEYELEEMSTGWRPGTPDNAPIVGRGGIDGLVVATGHYRNGILLAPVTAAAVAALLRGEEITGPMAGFGPERFGDAPTARRAGAPA
jgi:glycine oxidase